MKTRTELKIKPSLSKISYKDNILCLGSCFAENIGELLIRHKFKTIINPFGTIYNPVSITNLISNASSDFQLNEELYIERNEIFNHYHSHSKLASTDLDELKTNCETALNQLKICLKKCNKIIITLGTAYVHLLKKNKEIVANCHKMPANLFEKKLLSHLEINKSLDTIRSILGSKKEIIYTVSPIRHIKEGLEENNLSKSMLRVAIAEQIIKDKKTSYFPAYEIMNDDLRDYRYYNDDMIHPNTRAIQYIWDKFIATYLNETERYIINNVIKLVKQSEHKAFFPNTTQHQLFIKNTILKMKEMSNIDFEKEIKKLEQQLNEKS